MIAGIGEQRLHGVHTQAGEPGDLFAADLSRFPLLCGQQPLPQSGPFGDRLTETARSAFARPEGSQRLYGASGEEGIECPQLGFECRRWRHDPAGVI